MKRSAKYSTQYLGLAVLASVGLLASGCGGSKSPSVANIGTTTRPATSTASPTPNGDPAKLLDEWAACMRSHGDPNQADPTITVRKAIDITWNPAIPGGFNGTNKGGHGNVGPGQYCRTYLNRAQEALGGQRQKPPDPATMLKFSECMRAHGIPDFPDPSKGGLVISVGGDLDPHNPVFQNASRVCAQKTGVPGFGGRPQPGTIELNGAGP